MFQVPKAIKLQHETTYKPGLYIWEYTWFCVMRSTGDIAFLGKERIYDPVALHIYKYKNEFQKMITTFAPCSHQNEMKILPIMIENNERLLLSCWQCNTIWFYDNFSRKFSVALKEERFCPTLMSKGEMNYIFIVNWVKGKKCIFKASCTSNEIIVDTTKAINSKLEGIFDICYLPGVKLLAISRWRDHVVKAIHCGTGEQVWEVKGEVTGTEWWPHGLLYSCNPQSLIVCDTSGDGRLVILNPRDGSVIQVIPLPNVVKPFLLYLHDGNIILFNRSKRNEKVSVFTFE